VTAAEVEEKAVVEVEEAVVEEGWKGAEVVGSRRVTAGLQVIPRLQVISREAPVRSPNGTQR
jgi:hypothetical protein